MLALLWIAGTAGADDCPAQPLQVVGAVPASHATGVPTDARLIAMLGDGLGSADEWAVTLDWTEGTFPGTTDSWCHPDGGPEQVLCFLAFTPSQPLPPDTDFNVLVEATDQWTGTGDDREVFFITTGSASAIQVDGQPQLEVLAVEDRTPDCGWEQARVWDLTLKAAKDDFYGLSLLHVYGVDEDNSTHHVATRSVSAAGGLVSVSVARDQSEPWTDCFVTIQEDALGNRSPVSDMACWQAPTDTDQDTGTPNVGAGGCGCTQSPGRPFAFPLWMACVLGWGRRRRHTVGDSP